MSDADPAARAAAERWFDDQGLPYFVPRQHTTVMAAVSKGRLIPGLVAVLALSTAVGVWVGRMSDQDVSTGIWGGFGVAFASCATYAIWALHFAPIFVWAARRTFGSLSLIYPLVVRALPMLMLVMTFLFINTEIWQVCSSLSRTLLWCAVIVFAAIAAAFLLVRLPDEVHTVIDHADELALSERLVGTPLQGQEASVPDGRQIELSTLQRANLVLVMLVSQAIQVVSLAMVVFAFFIGFGRLVIRDQVIESWIQGPTHHLPRLDWLPLTNELFQVSVFLAGFSGLYFTVYAVMDRTYREQFFASIAKDLEQSIAVATVYSCLPDTSGEQMVGHEPR